jgi:glycosyltransferase involved in cell wall biosynthesis
MKNILFDLVASQPNGDGDFHGGGKYTKKIFLELVQRKQQQQQQQQQQNWSLIGVYDSSKYLDIDIKKKAEDNNIVLVDIKNSSLSKIVEELSVQRFFSALPLGIIVNGFNELLESNTEVYVTIHGLRSLETSVPIDALTYLPSIKGKIKLIIKKLFEKNFFSRDFLRFKDLLKKTKVVAVSNHTKYSIISFFPEVDNVKVFYSPDVTEFEDFDLGVPDFNMSNYFLMVSGNRWLKNNIRSAKALDEIFSERKDIKQNVIITGVSNAEIYLKHIKNKNRFIFYKYVDEDFLQVLYKNAFCFVYMSLNEGFGYPPLEAMKFGVPVIASPFTAVTEICDNAVLYCNPYSVKEIKSRMLYLLFDNQKYEELAVKAIQQFNIINKRQKEDLLGLIKYIVE